MAKTKRGFILATCFLSGAAAIISFVSLGTQEWVTSPAVVNQTNVNQTNVNQTNSPTDGEQNLFKFGLFGGTFRQRTAINVTIVLTTACSFKLNACALLCGDNLVENVEKLYNWENVSDANCNFTTKAYNSLVEFSFYKNLMLRATAAEEKRIFINAGMWFCTIFFLIISGVMGLFCTALSVWNTAANPYQVYFSIFGLYIYNAVALFFSLLAIILWGALFAQDLTKNIPSYKTFLDSFSTEGLASLGYSYWINLVTLVFYAASICLLYLRNYLISKEPEVNVHLEDNADPVIYLY